MKKIIALILLISVALTASRSFAQNDTVFSYHKSVIENLGVFRNTITDSTLDMMKELAKLQLEVISADKMIIDGYLDSLKTKADSLKQKVGSLTIEKESLSNDMKSKDDMFLYGIIGGGFLLLLFVVFFVLFLMSSAGKKKLKNQVAGIEKIKQDNLNEIEQARGEMQSMKTQAEKEIADSKDHVSKDAAKNQHRLDFLESENVRLEKRITEKTDECSELQIEVVTLKGKLAKKESEYKGNPEDSEKEKLLLEKKIFEKDLQIDNLVNDLKTFEQDYQEHMETCGDLANEKQLLEIRYAEKEEEFRHILEVHLDEIERLVKEKDEILKTQICNKEECEDLKIEKKLFEQVLSDKEKEFNEIHAANAAGNEKLKKEKSILMHDISNYKEMYENLSKEKQALELKLAEEKEVISVSKPDTKEQENQSEDCDALKEEIAELKKNLEQEIKHKNMMENELRRFIKELKKN